MFGKVRGRSLLVAVPWMGLALLAREGTAQASPVGTWNLETRNLAERATGGVRNVLLRVEEVQGELRAQMTSPRNTFLNVQEFRYEGGTIDIAFGAYRYTLSLAGDRLDGTMTSPVDTVAVTGTRQSGTMYAGDRPDEYVSTRTGLLGHRTELAPPDGESDPAAWVRNRIRSVEDYALILRGIPVSFTNPGDFESELSALVGRRVSVTGAWVGERYRIDRIELDGEGGR